jgi:hypothetical protein
MGPAVLALLWAPAPPTPPTSSPSPRCRGCARLTCTSHHQHVCPKQPVDGCSLQYIPHTQGSPPENDEHRLQLNSDWQRTGWVACRRPSVYSSRGIFTTINTNNTTRLLTSGYALHSPKARNPRLPQRRPVRTSRARVSAHHCPVCVCGYRRQWLAKTEYASDSEPLPFRQYVYSCCVFADGHNSATLHLHKQRASC